MEPGGPLHIRHERGCDVDFRWEAKRKVGPTTLVSLDSIPQSLLCWHLLTFTTFEAGELEC